MRLLTSAQVASSPHECARNASRSDVKCGVVTLHDFGSQPRSMAPRNPVQPGPLLTVMRDCHRGLRKLLDEWQTAPPPQVKRRLQGISDRLKRSLSADPEPANERPATKKPDPPGS